MPIANNTVNAVAMTVLPDAPVDPVTGLKVPTIAVATGGGISILQNSGTVRNSASTSAFTQVTLTPQLLSAGRADAVWYYAASPGSLGASFTLSTKNASTDTDFNAGNTTLLKAKDRANYARTSGALVNLLRNNEGTIGKGVAAKLSDTYNTGWLVGDIRRAYLANSKTADRSYKGATATETGTVTSAAVNTGNDLVAYSGFSAANYIREAYSADLDFGTGEWSVSAWVNTLNAPSSNFISNTATYQAVTRGFRYFTGVTYSTGLPYVFSIYMKRNSSSIGAGNVNADNVGTFSAVSPALNTLQIGVWTRVVAKLSSAASGAEKFIDFENITSGTASYTTNYGIAPDSTQTSVQITDGIANIEVWGPQLSIGSSAIDFIPTSGTMVVGTGQIATREHSSGAKITLGMNGQGTLIATAFDGTTNRTVSANNNTATWLKVRANYTTDGRLAILVNGVEVAATGGAPLLTLNNANAVLTIGNSYALDAPFPGSIALLKFSASVPTAEQALFMYEQEKHLFAAGAKCVLPSSGNVLDLAYDDATDTWSTLQTTHESSWSGLVRTSTQAPSAGSFSKANAASGVKLLGRTTTNPGVDVQMPAKNLRPKDMPRDINQDIVVFDYLGGFTATTTNGSTSLTSVASSLVPATTNLIGCAISGTGIPASTVITGVSGTTIYMSKAATANGSSIQISTTDFNLPVGYTARAVLTAGTLKREGSTADFNRLHDGFRETIRYAVAPGYNAWVQIQAVKEVAL